MSDENQVEIKMEDFLVHHGVKGMHWGEWNDETRRKYLGSGGSTQTKSLAEKAIEKVKVKRQAKRELKIAEERRQKEELEKQQAAEKRNTEIKAKYGLTAEQYDKMRTQTLNSHDPMVVAKGMKYLTDDELNAKIQRLEKEGKITSLAKKQQKETAEARKAELERTKATLPYRLGETAAKTIVNTVVNNVTKNTIGPVTSELSKAMGQTGVKALTSLRKQVGEQKPTVEKAVRDTKETVAREKETAKVAGEEAKAKSQQRKGKRTSPASQAQAAIGENLYSALKNKAANQEYIEPDELNFNQIKPEESVSSSKKKG